MVYTLIDHGNEAIKCSKLCSETSHLRLVFPLEVLNIFFMQSFLWSTRKIVFDLLKTWASASHLSLFFGYLPAKHSNPIYLTYSETSVTCTFCLQITRERSVTFIQQSYHDRHTQARPCGGGRRGEWKEQGKEKQLSQTIYRSHYDFPWYLRAVRPPSKS